MTSSEINSNTKFSIKNQRKFKILITGTRTVVDAGETALLFGVLEQLNRHIDNFEVVAGLTCDEKDFQSTLSESVVKNLRIFKTTRLKSHSLRVLNLVLRYIPEYLDADLVLDVSGDGFTDGAQYGMFASLSHASQLLMGVFFRKPIIVCAQSIGPFKSYITRLIGFVTLNKVDLITVREDITQKYLRDIGVSKPPVYLTADLAFLLDAGATLKTNCNSAIKTGKKRPVIGVSISQIIHTWAFPYLNNEELQYEAYIQSMAEIIDYALEKYDADALFVLHTTGAGARHDDREAAQKVMDKLKCRDRVTIVANGCRPGEIKQAISECEIFIASKMHTAVAATTLLVPTVSIAYNYKVYGIIGHMLKQDDLIVDIRTIRREQFVEQMKSKIDFVWVNKCRIRESLKVQTEKARKSAISNIQLIKQFLTTHAITT